MAYLDRHNSVFHRNLYQLSIRLVLKAMRLKQQNESAASRLLGISRSTLRSILKNYIEDSKNGYTFSSKVQEEVNLITETI